jgi:DNA repair exonuclease SbcCD ATPase subunit
MVKLEQLVMAGLNQRVDELRDQLEKSELNRIKLNQEYVDHLAKDVKFLKEMRDQVQKLQTRVTALEDALEEYGHHHPECSFVIPGVDCDCGLSTIRAGSSE